MTAPLHGLCPKCGYRAAAIVTASWAFTIDREVKSLNERGVGRGRWKAIRAYRDDKHAWVWMMRQQRLALRIPAATKLRRVTLTRIIGPGQRAYDRDNLVGGAKLIVDAMVLERLLLNDSAEGVELHHMQERGAASGLAVLIEEIG